MFVVTHPNGVQLGYFTHETGSPWPLPFKHSHWLEKVEPIHLHFTLRFQDGRKVYMDSSMASNGFCFMVTWTIFKIHLLEAGLIYNWETMTLWTLTNIELFYFIMCEDPHEWKFIESAYGWGPGHMCLCTILEGLWPHYMILEVSWNILLTLSFGLSELHGHGSWYVCEVAF